MKYQNQHIYIVLIALFVMFPKIVFANNTEASWKSSYQNIIEDDSVSCYTIYDIDEDSVPEIIYVKEDDNYIHTLYIETFVDDKNLMIFESNPSSNPCIIRLGFRALKSCE